MLVAMLVRERDGRYPRWQWAWRRMYYYEGGRMLDCFDFLTECDGPGLELQLAISLMTIYMYFTSRVRI